MQMAIPFASRRRSITRELRVLVACEFSGTVRNAFLDRGHDAWSCDLLPAEDGSNRHITGDARDILDDGWDMLIVAHPPCTRLCNSGVRWLSVPPPGKTIEQMREELREGAELFSAFWNAPIDRVCVENPVMHRHAKALIENYEEPAQSVQPWQFGHGEVKRTCFWLRGLPALTPTDIVSGREARVHRMPPGPDRWKERSRFFTGIAAAMADFDAHFPGTFGLDHRDMADDAMWAKINAHPSYFRDMPMCAGAKAFFDRVSWMNPIILTACPKSNYQHVAKQKREWVREHLSGHCHILPVMGGRNKPLFMHSPGDVLIDDFERNIKAWNDHGGIGILHREFATTAEELRRVWK